MSDLLTDALELHKQEMFSDAEKLYNKILEQEPENIQVLELLIEIKLKIKDFNSVLKLCQKILKFDKDNKEALFNSAISLKNLGHFDDAINYYKKVIELYPDLVEAYYNIATLYADNGDMTDSIYYYNKVLECNPDDKETKYFIGIAYMKNRQYKEGLKFFENRLCRLSALVTQEHTYPNLMQEAKLWQGEYVPDKTIYTYYEAGFGDVLMFARYLPLLEKKCKYVILKTQVPLEELFKENFPNIHVMHYFEPENRIHFDYHVPILSLPYALGLDEDNMFVAKGGYLKANPDKVKSYHDRFFDNDSIKIGIKWQGNTMYDWDRVIDVKEFIKLFQIPNTKFYSFQTFEGLEGINELKKYYDIVDIGSTLNNFSDTAGAIENLDLVICNDTSLAHVAGAMNKPCWVLLPYLYNWRWHQDLTKCDWYDSVKLFRQDNPRDWDSVFESLYNELSGLVK